VPTRVTKDVDVEASVADPTEAAAVYAVLLATHFRWSRDGQLDLVADAPRPAVPSGDVGNGED
jgi:hypothetical protein